MRSLAFCNRSRSLALALALLVPIAACDDEEPAGPPTIGIKDAADLPPVLTPEQCAAAVAQFPGWDKVAPLPEYDAQGLPTLWYALIPITMPGQIEELGALGVHVDTKPIFTDATAEAKWAGQTGSVAESTCGGAAVAWALVPGPVFNAIKTVTLDRNEVHFQAIIIQPVPGPFAEASITYQSMHPASYTSLRDAGFKYRVVTTPPDEPAAAAAVDSEPLLEWSLSGFISDAVNLVQGIPRTVTGWLGDADCWINGCVNLTVHLDVKNTDAAFGGAIDVPAGSGTDRSTPMLRAWGAHAGSQVQLPGVTVAAEQIAYVAGVGVRTRYEGGTNGAGSATFQVGRGRSTSICLRLENGAAQIRSFTWTKEICSFEGAATGANRASLATTAFDADTAINVKLQNKFFNMLAQFTDGHAYLRDVVGYDARQAKVLTGWAANLLNPLLQGRAVTPCLGFPNPALSLVNAAVGAVAALGGPISEAIVSYAQAVYEVDMWMPDGGAFASNRTLEDRTIPSHEYGHFAMCALLYTEDRTKAIQIPSLLIQRIVEGTFMDVGDETTRIMEAFADYFAGQTANGHNYLNLQNQTWAGAVKYCDGERSDCWDWNYVEDTTATRDPRNSTQALGTPNQMRRVATTLLDAFDGHPAGGNNPGSGDFWSWSSARGIFQPAARRAGDARDDRIVLPGSALRTLVRNWTHASPSPLSWAVNERQFFGALNATIRNTPRAPTNPAAKYSWCDACEMFAPHDGRSCASVGATATGGECRLGGALVSASMSMGQMVEICAQDPIRGFIGAPPSPSDPTSACTFTGCPARSMLSGAPGTASATCVACGAHQVSVGTRACPDCAAQDVGATACMECGSNQIVGGADANSCVDCPTHQIPNAARTACVACQNRQVAVGGLCLTCPAGAVAGPGETCQPCPAGQVPYNWNTCVPIAECVCGADYCRALDATGLLCVDIVG